MASVLLVEDNLLNRILVRDVLSLHGISVAEVETGMDAIEWVRRNPPPDLILMDIGLPGMDGIEAMKEIRSMEGFNSIPVVAITASAMVGDEERILSEGFDGYISKPINTEELVRVVKGLIGL